MKGSRVFLLAGIFFAIMPALFIKLNLWFKYQNHDWTFFSSRHRLDLSNVNSILLHDVKTFRYSYASDSTYLEYNMLYDSEFVKLKEDTLLSVFKNPKPTNIQSPINYFGAEDFSLFSSPDQFILPAQAKYHNGTMDIVLHGPICPPIKAINTTFYIDSVGENTSFDFDLDFSTFYWENFVKKLEGKALFDKKATFPWYLNKLNLKLNQSNFYLSNNIHFNKIDIRAFKKTDLDLDSDFYKEANIVVDSSVIVRAPVLIWKKLKLKVNTN